MKKTWEINASSIEESLRIAIKQIQKFCEKKKQSPVKILLWEEHSTEVALTVLLDDASDKNVVSIPEWINNQRTQHGFAS